MFGVPGTRWMLAQLRRYLLDQALVDRISVETLRLILHSGARV